MNYLLELQPIWQALVPIGAGVLFFFFYIMKDVRFLQSKHEWEMVLKENNIKQQTHQRTMLKWLDTSFHFYGGGVVGIFSAIFAITLYISGAYTVVDSLLLFFILVGLRWSGDLFLNWQMQDYDWDLLHQGKDNWFDKTPIPYRFGIEVVLIALLIINKLIFNI